MAPDSLGMTEMLTMTVVVMSQVCDVMTVYDDITCIQLFLYSNYTSVKLLKLLRKLFQYLEPDRDSYNTLLCM